MRLEQIYQSRIDAGFLQPDPAQREVVEHLQALLQRLTSPPPDGTGRSLTRRLGRKRRDQAPARGLYIWGGVGRGKTWLMDLFYQQLPIEDKGRIHFHRFMRQVHQQMDKLQGVRDPLVQVAARLRQRTRVLCLDEFIVNDIGDAMILAQLLNALIEQGVTLVTTSNTVPDKLYQNGIQRASFLPAIALLEKHTRVIELGAGIDYRLRYLEQAEVYHTPLDERLNALLQEEFRRLASEPGQSGGAIQIFERDIAVIQVASDVVWFDFMALCGPPRSQSDFLELARCYHTVLISGIPLLTSALDDSARRFLYLLDEFYDRNVKIIVSAAAPPESLYRGKRLAFEFRRAASRLREMQSSAYMTRAHKP